MGIETTWPEIAIADEIRSYSLIVLAGADKFREPVPVSFAL